MLKPVVSGGPVMSRVMLVGQAPGDKEPVMGKPFAWTAAIARLNDPDGEFVLATSAQPCCQCYGATVWAGINELLIGARSEDVEELTEFDEGPLPADWVGELERRGITVKRDILREQARGVFLRYRELGGANY